MPRSLLLALVLVLVGFACGERPAGLVRGEPGGEGGTAPGEPEVRLEPASIDFGPAIPGSTTCLPVAAVNVGDVDVVPVEVLFEGDLAAGIFSADSGGILGVPLAPGESGAFGVCHTARAFGTRHLGAVVVIMEDGARATAAIGAGVEAGPCEPVPDATELRFVAAPGETDERTLVLDSPGPAACWVWGLRARDAWFQVEDAPAGPQPIAPGAGLAVSLRYVRDLDPGPPTSSSLLVEHAGGGTVEVALLARQPEICLTVERNPIEFGRVAPGMTASRALRLGNCDVRPIRIGGNDPPRTPAGDVSLREGSSTALRLPDPPTDVTLQPGEELSIEVRFTPLTRGQHEGTLDVWMHGAAGPISVSIEGTAR